MRLFFAAGLCTLLLHAFEASIVSASPTDSWSSTERNEHGHWHVEASDSGIPSSVETHHLLVRWRPLAFDRLGNHLLISGEIRHQVRDGKAPESAGDLALTILVLKSTDKSHDWKDIRSDIDVAYECIVAKDKGGFRTRIDLSETDWDRLQSRQIQIGVSVGKITKTKAIWDAADPLIRGSVVLMDLPAVKSLAPELSAINSVRRWPKSGTGTDFIRAINLLQKLPAADARNTLREYCRLVPEQGFGDDEVVYWIVKVLYSQANPEDPHAPIGQTSGIRNALYMTSPIEIVDDIPFVAGSAVALGGYLEPPRAAVRWAQQYGLLKTGPLIPKSSPILAAESLLNEEVFAKLENPLRDQIFSSVRRQAIMMIEHLIGPQLKAAYIPGEHFTLRSDDDVWKLFLEDAQRHPVAWNEEQQQFELKEKKR
jgi:hypothetical protein